MKTINYKGYDIEFSQKESYFINDIVAIQFDTIEIGIISEIKNIGAKDLFKTETTVLFPAVWHITNTPQEFLDKYCNKNLIVNKALCFRPNKKAF